MTISATVMPIPILVNSEKSSEMSGLSFPKISTLFACRNDMWNNQSQCECSPIVLPYDDFFSFLFFFFFAIPYKAVLKMKTVWAAESVIASKFDVTCPMKTGSKRAIFLFFQ